MPRSGDDDDEREITHPHRSQTMQGARDLFPLIVVAALTEIEEQLSLAHKAKTDLERRHALRKAGEKIERLKSDASELAMSAQ